MIERKDLIITGEFSTIAGPCAVESEEQIYNIATVLSQMGIKALRAMYGKPRTNPKDFQGIGLGILPTLREIKRKTDLIIVSEIQDKDDLEVTKGTVDVIQVGSRNMQNYPLLRACAKDGRPVILKRGMISTAKEWVSATQYLGPNYLDKVVLCERGIRTGIDGEGQPARFTLDIAGAVAVRNEYGIPIIGDPSHAAGRRDLVPPLARSIAAAGLDGMIIEVHQNPDAALCDAKQQITPETFREVLGQVQAIHRVVYPYKEGSAI